MFIVKKKKKVKCYNQQSQAVRVLISKPYFLKSTISNYLGLFKIFPFILIFLRPCSQGGHRQKKAGLSQSSCSLKCLAEYFTLI